MSAEGVEKQAVLSWMCLACSQEYEGDYSTCPKDGTALIALNKEDPYLNKTIADRYHVTEIIGKGGMGVVYLARHQMMDRLVALKMLQAELMSDEMSVKRFQQEAKAASHLSHPHLITLHDFGIQPPGQPYLVMEYLEGVSLLSVLREGPLEPKRAVKIFSEIADGLYHAHKQGILHRDLKPSNIILINHQGDPDFVKIVDFGLAKLMPWSGKESQHLTKTGEVFGSPIYMSPEQCMGKQLWETSDIYSLGITLFEALTGKPPFRGKNSIDTASRHMQESPPRFHEVRPDLVLPEGLEKVVLKCLAKKSEDRFQDMAEFKDALQAGLLTEPKVEMPASLMVSTRAIPALSQAKANSMSSRAIAEPPARRPVSDLRTAADKPRMNPKILGGVAAVLIAAGAGAYVFAYPQPATTRGLVSFFMYENNQGEMHVREESGGTKVLNLTSEPPKWMHGEAALGLVVLANYARPMMAEKNTGTVSEIIQEGPANIAVQKSVDVVSGFLNETTRRNTPGARDLVANQSVMQDFDALIKPPFRVAGKVTNPEPDNKDVPIEGKRPTQAFKVVSSDPKDIQIIVDGQYFEAGEREPPYWLFHVDGTTNKITSAEYAKASRWTDL